jgi:hypothetical protein
MIQRFFKLETVIRRAPLGMRFLDLVRGVSVTDGLVVSAWRIGTSGPRQIAFTSPLSGVYGFRTLPGFRPFEVGERPASDWCASPPDVGEPTADELTSLDTLQGLLRAEESPPTGANFIVYVEDRQGRFLPQVMLMCLPKERLVEVPLFSSPARLAPAGLGVVRGELAIQGSQPLKPASWALVAASLDSHTYVGVADARGMFILFVPYASALPPLEGSPPHGSGNIDQLTWPLTISVFYQPSRQQFVPDLDPPDILSILEQGRATVYDRVGVAGPNLVRSIRFGADLVVATVGQSQLFVDPAPP